MKRVALTINGNTVIVAFDENSIHIYNAYPIKDDLKKRDYHWNPEDKSWWKQTADVSSEIESLGVTPETEKARDTDASLFPQSYSVTELHHHLDRIIKGAIGAPVWVRGIIASELKVYQWWVYFDFKDEEEKSDLFFRVKINKAHFQTICQKLSQARVTDQLEKDLPLFCLAEVQLSDHYAVDIRLQVVDVLPEYTLAKIRNQREITIEKLKQEGILDRQKQLSLPALISNIGLITSEQGTSIKDVIASLAPGKKRYNFYFVDTRMEGARAVESVLSAIDYLETKKSRLHLDAIIIVRGGGSEQSLAVFNDYRLCRRVCLCPIPILTAIGHEKDLSAIEICSYLTPHPATPSGMGKFLMEKFKNTTEAFASSLSRLTQHFYLRHQLEMERLQTFVRNFPGQGDRFLQLKEERLAARTRELSQSALFYLKHQYTQALALLNPLFANGRLLLTRQAKLTEGSLARIDFLKRKRENKRETETVVNKINSLFTGFSHLLLRAEKMLANLENVVQANNPDTILRKGFTLTLDYDNRFIKSVTDFNKISSAILRFHDGQTDIVKKED